MPWPRKLKTVWQVKVGEGHSSPVIAQDTVFLLVRDGGNEKALCLSVADGSESWSDAYPVPYTPVGVARGHGKGPFATSTIDGGRVYTYGITGILSCFDLASGKLLWRKDFSDRFKKTYPLYGHSCSPLIEGDLCIVAIGADDDGALVAFNKLNGEVVWQYTDDGPSYASPIAVDLAGRRQIVTFMQTRMLGVAAETGDVLWQFPHTTQHTMNVIAPVVSGDLVVLSGFREGARAARITKKGEALSAKQVWHRRNLSIYMSSPMLYGDHLYGLCMKGYQKGALACIDIRDGKLLWESPRTPYYASIVRVGNKLLVMKINGELTLMKATPTRYVEIGTTRVSRKPVWAHIALADGRLYVKDRTDLMCYELE